MSFFNNVIKRFTIWDLLKEAIIVFGGYFLLLFSYLTPRNKKKWAFGNKNTFRDNTKYLFLYLLENNNDIKPIWISSSRHLVKELRQLSYPAYYKYSIKGLYHCLTAGVYISNINTNYINFFTSGRVFNVYLWHGIGLKSLPDAKSMPWDKSIISRICMPYAYEKIDFLLSTTPMIDEQFMLTFNIPEKNLYSGMYPRCSFMLRDKADLLNYIHESEPKIMSDILDKMSCFNKVFVYMPTWRIDYGSRFLEYAIPDLEALNKVLEKHNYLLLLKLHPSMHYDSFKYKDLNNIYYIDATVDIYPILPFTDVLITDYSSIYTDYLLLPEKGVILYDFDLERYIKNEFGFYRDYNTYTPGKHISDFKCLLSTIDADTDSFIISDEQRSWVLHEMWGNYENKNSSDLVEEIKKRLDKR